MHQQRALLALEDGQIFEGYAIGASGETCGEIVFNTAMTGYQEILTDPSYSKQIINFTSPHIGNTGINAIDNESERIHAAGLIVRDFSSFYSNWRATSSLHQFLIEHQTIGICNVDTRALTRKIRNTGNLHGCIQAIPILNKDRAIKQAQEFAKKMSIDFAKNISISHPYLWQQSMPAWQHNEIIRSSKIINKNQDFFNFHVVAYDFGVKHTILKLLVQHGCQVTVVPATTSAEEALALQPQGIFLSNGPGDPALCTSAVETIKKFLQVKIPIFGICLGFQLLALACGGHTFKMKFGHRGANHPVINLINKKIFVSSQNHGFAVTEDNFPKMLEITHRSLFDNTIQGIRHRTLPVFAFQGHPEASPGPTQLTQLFAEFSTLMALHRQNPLNFSHSMEQNLHD